MRMVPASGRIRSIWRALRHETYADRWTAVGAASVCGVFVLLVPHETATVAAQAPLAIVCPAVIPVTETPSSQTPWTVERATAQRAFERISVFNKTGDQEFDLAPDDQTQTGKIVTQAWILQGYRSMPLYVRCRYRDTAATLAMALPPAVQRCTLRFTPEAHGGIAAGSSMSCR